MDNLSQNGARSPTPGIKCVRTNETWFAPMESYAESILTGGTALLGNALQCGIKHLIRHERWPHLPCGIGHVVDIEIRTIHVATGCDLQNDLCNIPRLPGMSKIAHAIFLHGSQSG